MELFKAKLIACFLIIGLYFTPLCHAHTPLIACSDNGDGTVTCEGGFSDGSSASGVELRVERDNGRVLIKGEMSEDSEYTFDKPSQPCKVVFDAGDGHLVQVFGKEISE